MKTKLFLDKILTQININQFKKNEVQYFWPKYLLSI